MKNWLHPDRFQPTFLPATVDELLPENHLARFIVDIVDQLDLAPILAVYTPKAHGSAPYHPAVLLALLLYGYATGVASSRAIERATHDSIAFRYIAAGLHPDHDTIASFRRRHLEALKVIFLQVLLIATEAGMHKLGHVALDGTKIMANASKHSAVSHKRAKELEVILAQEVDELMEKAEKADSTPIPDGFDVPAEIAFREKRQAAIKAAREAIEERAARKAADEYKEKMEKHLAEQESALDAILKGEEPPPVSPEPPPPDLSPADSNQYNYTDPDSRIMPDKGGFTQAYNAQAGVDTESRLIVMNQVLQDINDKKALLGAIALMAETCGAPQTILADAGYFSAENIRRVPDGIDVYISPGRIKHGKRLEELLRPPATGEPPPEARTPAEKMRHKLDTEEGRKLYGLRKSTVEPVFGIIKQATGLRQFLLRGLDQVRGEWNLMCLGYNLRRMHTIKGA